MPLYIVWLCLNIHSYIGVPWHYWMVCLVGERSSGSWEILVLSIVFFFYWDHWGAPLSPTFQSSSSSYIFPSSCIPPHGNLLPWQPQGRPADHMTSRPLLWQEKHSCWYTQGRSHAGAHSLTGKHRSRRTLTCTHTWEHTHTHTHKWHLSTLLCHVTAQPRWASLSCAMSTGYNAFRLVLLFLQLFAHWLQVSVVCLCGNVQVSSFWNVQ